MDETLKPCPAECLHTVDRGGPSLFRRRGDIFGVYCQTCQCSTEYYSTEAEAITAWNTRADAAPTPKADEVEAVARALAKANRIEICDSAQYAYSSFREPALAAIAALAAARGDPVARVVEWLRACSLSSAIPDDPAQMIADLADAIEQSFANKT